MRSLYIFLFSISLIANLQAQSVKIQDTNFLKALKSNGVDRNQNGVIEQSEALTIKYLDLKNQNITDFTGLEEFVNISYLDCSMNQPTFLDVSKNTALDTLICYLCSLSDLDVSKNIALTYLVCENNQISNLNVSLNTSLKLLSVNFNYLTDLDLSQNTTLTYLECAGNYLGNLDITHNTLLTQLNCGYNAIKSLDLSQNINVIGISCYNNLLTTLDLSKNLVLNGIYCGDNQMTTLTLPNSKEMVTLLCNNNRLTELDLQNTPHLTSVRCNSNLFTSLDLRKNIDLKVFECGSNPFLKTICVNDTVYAHANFVKDNTAKWSKNCSLINYLNKDSEFIKPIIYPNPTKDFVNVQGNIDQVNIFNSYGQLVLTSKYSAIDICMLPKGIYQIQLSNGQNVVFKESLILSE